MSDNYFIKITEVCIGNSYTKTSFSHFCKTYDYYVYLCAVNIELGFFYARYTINAYSVPHTNLSTSFYLNHFFNCPLTTDGQ
jgi:hypothetical protein